MVSGHVHNHAQDSCSGGAHGHDGTTRSLAWSLAITLGFMAVEAVGGWLTNSLALISDAGHMLTDAAALALSLLALRLGERPPSVTKSFGYRRLEILAALLNGLALWGIVGIILHEAYRRLISPQEVRGLGMVAVAGVGLIVNLVAIRLLHRHKDENLNVRGAFLHVVADSLGSVGALVAGVVVWKTGWDVVDPAVSVGICLLILWSSWGLVREAVHVLLLGVPPHLDYREIQDALLAQDGVCCLYDLHVWSISSGHDALSAHVVVPDNYPRRGELLHNLVNGLRERFGIEHATLQLEESHEMKEARGEAVCKVEAGGAACTYTPSSEGPAAGT